MKLNPQEYDVLTSLLFFATHDEKIGKLLRREIVESLQGEQTDAQVAAVLDNLYGRSCGRD